ncbi:DKNYY domain-containing protein [Flavobacteriaceae bacterium]|nr:DKNYY domain-containing protein [Flavobacteriaceae bacterium]
MQKKIIIYMGLLSLLFGCSDREVIDPQKSYRFLIDTKTNEVFYKHPPSAGGLISRSIKLPTNHPKDFVILSKHYATDGRLVFYTSSIIEKANLKGFIVDTAFSNYFAKDSISKTHYYQDNVLNLDYNSAKIHSERYISDKNKVLFNDGTDTIVFDIKIPVQDVSSFELVNKKSRNGSTLSKDKRWLYLNNIQLPVPSKETQIIQLGLPTILLHKDILHYTYPSYIDVTNIRKSLLPSFKATEGRIIGKSKYNVYYHFKISGLKNATQINDSYWMKDDNGLYYMYGDDLTNISKKQYKSYDYNSKFPNHLRTNSCLFGVYYKKNSVFSASGQLLSDAIVIDNNTVFYEGDEIENSDAATFIKLEDYRVNDFIDKNFYYRSGSGKNRYQIPHWAYKEFKTGELKAEEISNIAMKYTHTVYKKYWNGFLVTMKVPTRNNTDNKLSIEFKNIERKVLKLDRPLEEKIFLFIKKTYKQVDANDISIKLSTTDVYNFKQIEKDAVITFIHDLPTNVTDSDGLQYTFPYFLTLSSINQPDGDNYNELYIQSEAKD